MIFCWRTYNFFLQIDNLMLNVFVLKFFFMVIAWSFIKTPQYSSSLFINHLTYKMKQLCPLHSLKYSWNISIYLSCKNIYLFCSSFKCLLHCGRVSSFYFLLILFPFVLLSFSSGGEDGYIRLHHFDSDYFNIKM